MERDSQPNNRHPHRHPDERLVNPAADRNKAPILEVLERVLPESGLVLEIASGTGQHAAYFAKALPALIWQPSDPDARSRHSILAWKTAENLSNVRAPIDLDVHARPWPVGEVQAIVCINMIHISPWSATLALFDGAADVVGINGTVYLYGPYRRHGRHTSASNEEFDRSLHAQNPAWGVRDLDEVARVADGAGFELVETVGMPANNLSVVFRKRAVAGGAARQ